MDIELVLQNFGFSDKETAVYLSLLELENATASELANLSNINRSTVYVIIESLTKSGFINTTKESGSISKYTAAPPEHLLELAKNQRSKYTKMVKDVEEILPKIRLNIESRKVHPRVQFFDGNEGLVTAYEDTLTSSETIRAYASIENMHRALPGYFPEYYSRRARHGIHIKSIHPDTPEAREREDNNQSESRTSALVPADKYNFSPEINIYDNKIVFMSLVEKFSLIIESAELAEAFKKIFDLSWNEATRLDKRKS